MVTVKGQTLRPHILVTGATGTVGSEVVNQLRLAGVRVRAASHYPDRTGYSRAAANEYVEVDFRRPETLATAFNGIDKAVLITPETADMAEMTAHLVKAAEQAGVRHLVRLSMLHAGTGIGGALLDWHAKAEEIAETSAIPHTCLRPNSFMQNFLVMYRPAILALGAFYAPLGSGRISYIDVRDVAAAVVEVLLTNGHEQRGYSLTGPEALSHAQIAAILSREVGRPIAYVDTSEPAACAALARRGASPRLLEALCDLWQAMRADEFAVTTQGFEELVGRKPRSFESFARDYRRLFKIEPKRP
jgi:uncharacterized protein YbjT (DUF2867 family)